MNTVGFYVIHLIFVNVMIKRSTFDNFKLSMKKVFCVDSDM